MNNNIEGEKAFKGKMIVFTAPSGGGKTTIVRHLLAKYDFLDFSVSATTRQKRVHEVEGKDYYFLSPEVFRQKEAAGEFIEWEEVYTNNFYGTLKSEIERIWAQGKAVIFDVDVIGGLNLKKQFADQAFAVFVQPPSYEELEKRLRGRSTETEEKINQRMEKASKELAFAKEFDTVLINDDLQEACAKAEQMIAEFLKK